MIPYVINTCVIACFHKKLFHNLLSYSSVNARLLDPQAFSVLDVVKYMDVYSALKK